MWGNDAVPQNNASINDKKFNLPQRIVLANPRKFRMFARTQYFAAGGWFLVINRGRAAVVSHLGVTPKDHFAVTESRKETRWGQVVPTSASPLGSFDK